MQEVVKRDLDNAKTTVRDMGPPKKAAIIATIGLSILQMAFLIAGSTPWSSPADWNTKNQECVWQQNQVDTIRLCVWGTLPLWIFELVFPMFLFGSIRTGKTYYKAGVFVFVIVNMLMTVNTSVTAVLLSVGSCSVDQFRVRLCWAAVAANVLGIGVGHFNGGDED